MLQQLTAMLEMQDRMNRKVHPDWISQQFAWYRALWIECGELVEHYGYKWWKAQQPDWEQVRLEIVDIWHFGMSMRFGPQDTPGQIAAAMLEELEMQPPPTLELREAVESLAAHALVRREFSVSRFWSVLQAAGISPEQLFSAYVGKNVLNFFRQDHGYKEGSYCKVWSGREDNEHLVEIVNSLDNHDPAYAEHLYAALQQRYVEALGVNS
jgi:dimeric dUTPase (all-alpha-NTP-PPase superfamily)